jgi:hypothetical protein
MLYLMLVLRCALPLYANKKNKKKQRKYIFGWFNKSCQKKKQALLVFLHLKKKLYVHNIIRLWQQYVVVTDNALRLCNQ